MRLKSIILLATTATLVGGIGFINKNSGFGKKPVGITEEVESEWEEENGAQSILGGMEAKYSLRLNEKTQTLDPAWVQAAIDQADKLSLNRRASNLLWENMGPDNQGGRIRAFLLHKDSLNLMFASGVSGGLWRSNTSGQSWNPVNDHQEDLNVNCIAQTIDGTIYYGSGEGGIQAASGIKFNGMFPGSGVYKSTDSRGTKFTLINSTKNGQFDACNSMVAHPTVNKVFVATENGVFASTNGTTFTSLKGGAFKELAIDKAGILWAANGSGTIFKSDAAGSIINTAVNNSGNGFPPSGGRTTLAISPQDDNTAYAMASSGGKLTGVYRTSNGGQSWEKIINSGTVTDPFGNNSQGWYDNVIAVDPSNKNRIYMGGVVLATWDNIDGYREIASEADVAWNSQYVHADKHIIQFDTRVSPELMIVGTDGGLSFSRDRNAWTRQSRGLITLQLYTVCANSLGYMLGGAQDNGCQLMNFNGNAQNGQLTKNTILVNGGDGFDCEFSKIFSSTLFVSSQNGAIRRSGNLGQSVSSFWDKRIKDKDADRDPTPQSDFFTVFNLWERASDSASMLFYARQSDIWVAINPTNFANPVNWFRITTGMGNGRISEMDATKDGDHLFVSKTTDASLWRVDNLQSANFSITVYPTATDIPSPITKTNITPAAAAGRAIVSVHIDQANDNHVVITLGGYGNTTFLYETTNALAPTPTWKNITGDLPQSPVYDALIDIDNPLHMLAGTDLGIWETTNGGVNWVEANNGMARVPVYEIRGYEFKPWEGMSIYLGTHGRGFFRSLSLVTKTDKVVKDQIKLNAYPNPANSFVNIGFDLVKTAAAVVEIFGMDGRLYQTLNIQGQTGSNAVPVSVAKLTNGYYFARVISNGKTNSIKFSVSK